jgi:hypothetical protein
LFDLIGEHALDKRAGHSINLNDLLRGIQAYTPPFSPNRGGTLVFPERLSNHFRPCNFCHSNTLYSSRLFSNLIRNCQAYRVSDAITIAPRQNRGTQQLKSNSF